MIDGHRGQSGTGEKDSSSADPEAAEKPELESPAATPSATPGRGIKTGFGIGARLVRIGVTADEVTIVGLLLAAATGVSIALGHFWIGIVLLTVGGLMDTLDGVVAKAAGSSSKKGAFFDSVSDRVADGLIFGGAAWYLASGSDPRLAVLPFAIFGVSATISYERAKAESLGYDAKGGLMERAERLILLGVALVAHVIFVPVLGLLLALSSFTAIQRFVKVWGQASKEIAKPDASHNVWRRGRVESRWQAWRQPRASGARRRASTPSRVRARRREEPLGMRLRRVLTTELSGEWRTRPRPERRNHEARSARRKRSGTES
ncbi:MAG: CDP-alcohol phosphatidyltransferase family protein [Acidimicrobiales bacterium]